MSRSSLSAALAAGTLVVAACGGPLTGAQTFDGTYRPGLFETPPQLPRCAVLPSLAVTAAAVHRQDVGERFEEDKPAVRYPIAMRGDVARYVDDALKASLRRAGPTPEGRAVLVRVEVASVQLVEKTFHNAEYKGSVTLDVTVPAADGTVCWTGRIVGDGENYGRAGSEENYEETLARTVDAAARTLLRDRGFGDALCGQCTAAAQRVSTITP